MNLDRIQSTETVGLGDRARRISAISARSQALDALQKQQQQRHSDHWTQNQQMSNDLNFYNSKMGTQTNTNPPQPSTSNSGIHRPLSNTSKPILKLNATHSLNPINIEDYNMPDLSPSQKPALGSHHTTKSTAMFENTDPPLKTPPRPKFGLDNPYNSIPLQYKLEKLDQNGPTMHMTGQNQSTEELLKGQAL